MAASNEEFMEQKLTPDADRTEAYGEDDPFNLPRQIRQKLKGCLERNGAYPNGITYLWAHVSDAGFAQPETAPERNVHPTLEEWLNVIDEAAALGVNWLVLSLNTGLSAAEETGEICRWAQETHAMNVGIHVLSGELNAKDIAILNRLDPRKTRIIVKQHLMDTLAHLEEKGVKLMAADPQPYGVKPDCQGPARMVFVDPHGHLYTCGLVEGNQQYHLGSIYEDSFHSVMYDPGLPHKLCDEDHIVAEGCDGCPSLVANFFKMD
jgi:radical SAM protein with 4Fe4S-binding SPASM domain